MNGVSVDTRNPECANFRTRIVVRVMMAFCLVSAWVGLINDSGRGWLAPKVAFASPDSNVPSASDDIAEVRVEGNVTIPTASIEKYVKTRPGRPFNQAQVRADIRALYGTRWFFSVEQRFRWSDEGLILIYKVLERPVVEKVEFIGNKKLKTKHLAAETGLKVGSPYDISANLESTRRLERLYREKGFTFATVELEKGDKEDDREVIFRINEGPKVKIVRRKFEGNEAFSSALLRTKLRTKSAILYTIGGNYDPNTIPDDIDALTQYYQSLGYFDVQTDHEVRFNEKRSRGTIVYKIDEGLKSKVRGIEFVGNRVFTDEDLEENLKLRPGDDFNARTLNKDLVGIKNRYGSLGRLFSTVEAVPVFLENPGEVDLQYRIDEDQVFTIGKINVHIEGDNPHTKRTEFLNYMQIQPGDLANQKKIRLSERRLQGSQIAERGGPNAPRIVVNRRQPENSPRGTRTAARGQSPHRSAYRQPNLARSYTRRRRSARQKSGTQRSGRSRFPWHSVARPVSTTAIQDSDLPFYPPGSENPSFYVHSQQQLTSNSTVIRGQTIDGIPTPASPLWGNSPQGDPFGDPLVTPPGEVDLDVYVTEARTGRLMFGVGVNSDAGVVGSIVLSEQNFDLFRPPRSFRELIDGTAWRGAGQRFRLEAVPGNVVSRYLMSWTDPYFLDTDFSLGVSGFYYNRFFTDWDEQRAGGRVSFGRQFTPTVSAAMALRLEDVEITNPDVPTPPLLAASVGNNFLSSLRGSVTHDTRDSPFLPAEGHVLELSYEQAFGDFSYPRAEAEARQFYTLYARPDGGGRHTLSIGGQVGWTGDDTPIFERFYAGGFQTFRGFDFRGVSPRQFGVRVGGRWLMLASAEYMAPLMANEMIQGVLFTDTGTVQNDVGVDKYRVTAGFGLRVTVPAMGPVPLAFDFAFPVLKQDEDDTRVFSFYVGVQN